MAATATRRVNVDFPEPLLAETEKAASELNINRSNLIRAAVEDYLRTRRHALLQKELAAACEANADLAREICAEFSWVDAENI